MSTFAPTTRGLTLADGAVYDAWEKSMTECASQSNLVTHRTVGMRTACFLTLLLGVAASAAADRAKGELTLAEGGRTGYVITVGEDASAPERNAAKELASYLGAVTGAEFAVTAPAEVPADQLCIMVGQTESIKKLLPGVDWESLGDDGIVIKTKGRHLILAGGRPRGTLYAVYTFLEDFVGCRWWTSTEEDIPHRPTLIVTAPSMIYIPPLSYREVLYLDVTRSPGFAVKLKNNGYYSPIAPEFGDHYQYAMWGHSFEQLLPPEKYFAEHPEWYSLINGQRFAKGHSDWQLCLTNVQMRKELTKNVLEAIRQHPEANGIWVAQNDGYGQCQCDNCRVATEREGAGAGPLLELVNAVAEEVEREHPGFLIETLAYHWTRKAPLHVRPRSNVVIRLCGLECDFAQPLDSAANAEYRDDIEKWSAITPNLLMYHYMANFGNFVQPYPNIFNIGPDARFFVKNRAAGAYIEADNFSPIGDFVRLRAWVVGHMLWDPSRDPVSLVEEFARGYYGLAGPHILAYLKLTHNAVKRSGMRLSYASDDTSFLTLDEMNRATVLWNSAEAAVGANPSLLERVRRDRIPFDQAWLQNWAQLKQEAARTSQEFLGSGDIVAACADYLARATELSTPYFVNAGKTDAAPALRELCRKQLELYAKSREGPSALPDELRGVGEDRYHILQTDAELLTNKAQIVDDPSATTGKAVRLADTWSMAQWHVKAHFMGRWRVYVRVRCELQEATADGQKGSAGAAGYLSPQQAFQIGILDNFLYPFGRYVLVDERGALEKVNDGAYHTYDLGVHDLKPGMFVWVTIADAKGVSAVYVDRVFLVRDGAK